MPTFYRNVSVGVIKYTDGRDVITTFEPSNPTCEFSPIIVKMGNNTAKVFILNRSLFPESSSKSFVKLNKAVGPFYAKSG